MIPWSYAQFAPNDPIGITDPQFGPYGSWDPPAPFFVTFSGDEFTSASAAARLFRQARGPKPPADPRPGRRIATRREITQPRAPRTPVERVEWREWQAGFFLPPSIDGFQFPPYDEFDPELPDLADIVVIGDTFKLPKFAWGAWFDAQKRGVELRLDPDLALKIAWKLYESQRYIHVVPAWRREVIGWIQEIDDIEDQVSTIAWLAETVLQKFIPIPRGILGTAKEFGRTLDRLQGILAIVPTSRRSKAEYDGARREARAAKRGARSKLAKLLDWFMSNWGNMLEAAQATNTWFDVGIVLGPIMAMIEDGLWKLGKNTLDNFLVATDAVLPGYRDVYYETWTGYTASIDQAWDATWEQLVDWDRDVSAFLLGPKDPFQEFTP